MAELHETQMGQKLIMVTMPGIMKALERIANSLEDNKNQEIIQAGKESLREREIDEWIEEDYKKKEALNKERINEKDNNS